MRSQEGQEDLKRRLKGWQIFFIAIGGIIGVGFFRDSSTTLALAGPLGSLIAVIVVGIVVVAVMEGICEMIVIWPIPNAMVKFVNTFVDEDLGVAVGFMYWYLYCVTFSLLVITVGDLADYWLFSTPATTVYIYKALIYVFVPMLLTIINCAPVWLFGWIEFFGGIIKLGLVVGTIIFMLVINAGGGYGPDIGVKYFKDGVQNNPEAAGSHAESVFAAIPLAIYAYIGVELLTTTAFEAADPEEMKLPASNVGWFSLVLYAFSTGAFVSNVSWQDQQLPKLFNQALVTVTGDPAALRAFSTMEPQWPDTHAAPLVALYRNGWRTAPSILNGLLIYSAISCANTALYVASRQLYGLTRSIDVTPRTSLPTRFFASMSRVHPKWHSPVFAILVTVICLVWLPFIKLRSNTSFLDDVVSSLANIGSVSAILMWCSQCVAYIRFSTWRERYERELKDLGQRWEKLFDDKKAGYGKVLQPWLAWLGAICTVLIVFLLSTIPMWNGKELTIKSISTFVSPVIVLAIWLLKKLIIPHGERKFFVDLTKWDDFESRLQNLDELIYPVARKPKPGSHQMQLMQKRSDPEMAGVNAPYILGAANDVPREDSIPNPYDREDLITEGQGYGYAGNGDISPIERDESNASFPNPRLSSTSLPRPQAQPKPQQQRQQTSPNHNMPYPHGRNNNSQSQRFLSPLARFAQSQSSHDAYEAETDISAVSSTHSNTPLRGSQTRMQTQATSGPESQWHGGGYAYGPG